MIEKSKSDLVVIADNPQDLAEGQFAIIEQVKVKQTEADEDLASAITLRESCEAFDMNPAHAKRLEKRARSRQLYLSKVREALEAGYLIVPNFPTRTIAIRVKRDKPNRQVVKSSWREPSLSPEQSECLPSGEGRYVEPTPDGLTGPSVPDEKGKDQFTTWATAFSEEIGLPVEFLKPTVIQMTGKMLARKIFDEVALVDDVGADPMVIGRIRDKQSKRTLSFLVAWFVDTKDI